VADGGDRSAGPAEGVAPERVFRERLTAPLVPDAWRFALPLAAAAAALAAVGLGGAAGAAAVLAGFVVWFFRNPERVVPAAPGLVVAPADGRVVAAGEIELPDGSKALRIGIFLSVFDVHVNRAPVAGRVLSVERSGSAYLAAFHRDAERRNVRATVQLETAEGLRVGVVQITGLIARRIVCHVEPGEWLARGARFGMIRFGSRTDVVLPPGSEMLVEGGDRVRGGATVVARLPEGSS
jgi:phosphatidylserine decarboxylase